MKSRMVRWSCLISSIGAALFFAAPTHLQAQTPIERRIPAKEGKPGNSAKEETVTVTVTIDTRRPLKSFIPRRAFGGGIDGTVKDASGVSFEAEKVRQMQSVGFPALTYRLRTELSIEAWHWNPKGTWSDSAHKQGYWTSDAHLGKPIRLGYGYRLPRRGSTIDQANNRDYSRLDDGDPHTFWKSNPYLDRHFTGEPNNRHSQWVVIDLGTNHPVNGLRLLWGQPFATQFSVEYWQPQPDSVVKSIDDTFSDGAWVIFPSGTIPKGHGGEMRLHLAEAPISLRFVRIRLLESSGKSAVTAVTHDIRDSLGYAIREVSLGEWDENGQLHDWVRHARNNRQQSLIYVSSTDPWHRAIDRDERVEQPGFDAIYKSGLNNRQPVLLPTGLLYDTPENAANELRYLRARHFPVTRIELGEEPDGQYTIPEDYSALYIQWARALHKVDSKIILGGPSLQTAVDGWFAWQDKSGNNAWVNRFVRHLQQRNRLRDLGFFSFEWYPFDDITAPPVQQLRRHPKMLQTSLQRLVRDGVSRKIPWIISEYGWSSSVCQPEVDIYGGLLNAEIVAQFLTWGGDTTYLYGYTPGELTRETNRDGATWGALALFLLNNDNEIAHRTAAYHTASMLAHTWVQQDAAGKPHRLYPAIVKIGKAANPTEGDVTAYVLRRPDSTWSLLLLNKSPDKRYRVTLRLQRFHDMRSPHMPLNQWQFSPAQYQWHAYGSKGYPLRSKPAQYTRLKKTAPILLPPLSLTVLHEN